MPPENELHELNAELDTIENEYSGLSRADVFVLWFLQALCVNSPASARESLTCSPNDGGIDAVFIDEPFRRVTIIQGKLRSKIGKTSESAKDVVGFARVATLLTGPEAEYELFRSDLADPARTKAEAARKRIVDDGYELDMFYVTTGKCSEQVISVAKRECQNGKSHLQKQPRFKFFDGDEVIKSLKYFLSGAAPPLPSVTLKASGGTDIAYQQQPTSQFESWVLIMNGRDVGELITDRGARLFALNIRGNLGLKTQVNTAMRKTLKNSPGSFLLRNNGITIVCEEAAILQRSGTSYLDVERPQIINGQQTTYALNASLSQSHKADVFVRVIAVQQGTKHDEIVSQIVESTNSQNRIKSSDLRSNDRIQVSLEGELRRRNYFYVRKVGKGIATAAYLKGMERVTMKGLAEAWMAAEDADFLRDKGSEGVFQSANEATYKAIFKTTGPEELLARWWLNKRIKQLARGNPEKAAAKNLVNQLVWSEAGGTIKSHKREFNDVRRYQKRPKTSKALDQLIEAAFKDAAAFHRKHRGKGADRVDAAPFFKRRGQFAALEASKSTATVKALSRFDQEWSGATSTV